MLLGYSPKGEGRRRANPRRVAAAVLVGLSALALVLVLMKASEWAWYDWQAKRAMGRACEYTAPPTQVIYDDDPVRAAGLLAGGGYQTHFGYCFRVSPLVYAWALYPSAAEGCGNPQSEGLAFLHERHRDAGRRQLIVLGVERSGTLQDGTHILYLFPTLIDADRPAGNRSRSPLALTFAPSDRVRIYAGQPDPADASHFTVGYDVNGAAGSIDCWLDPDDGVAFTVSGPAAKNVSR